MKKQIAIAMFSTALMWGAPASRTFTGIITDDMCKTTDHKAMNLGSNEKCVTECVKSMNAKYVLHDGTTLFKLSDQKAPAAFAARKVTVTGTLDAKTNTITVEKIVAAK
jgi:hypothetical protein